MIVTTTQMTMADYCRGLDEEEIIVNRNYQRSDQVWPQVARSFLVETVLLGFPVPKISLHQITDVRTRRSRKEIVDGQQRSQAFRDFLNNALRLPKKTRIPNAAGCTYDELTEELQSKFLDYAVQIDLFVTATQAEIREVFLRMNAYTVPLNPEEQRHSEFQGEFKWFIYQLCTDHTQSLDDIGALTQKQLVRMQDAKLFTEIVHALTYGITTTTKASLRKIYESFEDSFPEREIMAVRLNTAIGQILEWPPLHGGALMRPYQLYSLLLALIHCHNPVDILQESFHIAERLPIDNQLALQRLTTLAEVLADPERAPTRYRKFTQAGQQKTNTAEQRATRFQWFCRAICGERS